MEVGGMIAAAALGAALGFLFGRALLRFQLGREGYNVVFDGGKRLGEGRYEVERKIPF